MDHVEIDGLEIAYDRAGHGSVLALLHGFVGDGASTWRHQIDELSSDFTVIAWDCPGSGASADPPEPFGMNDYADCLAAFLYELGVRRAHIAGLSFGGVLALSLVERHPTVPISLALLGAYAGWAGSLPPEVAQERLRLCIDASELPGDRFADVMGVSMFSPSAAGAGVDAFVASVAAFHPAGFRAMSRALASADLRDTLESVTVPTLLLHGDEDVRAPLQIAQDMHDRIAGSQLVVLRGIGHVVSVEAPAQTTGALRSFLSDPATREPPGPSG
jgi:pimeloyl-ACP methyl ester carboxylesterase